MYVNVSTSSQDNVVIMGAKIFMGIGWPEKVDGKAQWIGLVYCTVRIERIDYRLKEIVWDWPYT